MMKSVQAQGATRLSSTLRLGSTELAEVRPKGSSPKSASGLLLLCLLAAGCDEQVTGAPPAKAKLTIEKIVESPDLVIVRVHMTFPGSRTVRVFEEGSSQMASIDPADKSKPGECDLLIAADLVDAGQKRHLKWMTQIKSRHVTAGGPSTYPLERDAKLADLLKIEIQPGEYDFGQEISVATLQGRPLKMTIE